MSESLEKLTQDNKKYNSQTIANHEKIEQQIFSERLKIMQNDLRISIPANLLCAVVVFIGLYDIADEKIMTSWLIAVTLTSTFRIGLYRWYKSSSKKINLHLTLFIIATCISALLWGIADSVLMPADDLVKQMIIIVIIAGITAGGLQTLQANFLASAVFVLLTVLPLAVWLLLHGGLEYFVLGIAMMAYLFFMLLLAWRGNHMIGEILKLRFENISLINQMSDANRQLAESNKSLRESENRFRSSFDYAAVGMGLTSLDGYWLKVNNSLCHIFGYQEKELLHMDFKQITYAEDLPKDLNLLQQLMQGKISSYHMEKRYLRKNGEIIWALLSVALVRDEEEKPLYFIKQIQDIDAQKKAEELLRNMAYHDPLTGLANRKQLDNSFSLALKYSHRHRNNIAVLFLDIDYFKHINDKYGHEIGDELLKIVADRLQNSVRSTDTVARLGGDEFVLILTEIINKEEAVLSAKKLRQIIAEPIRLKEYEIKITVSIGISIYPQDGQDLESLLKHADEALYQVKTSGRNHFKLYSTSN